MRVVHSNADERTSRARDRSARSANADPISVGDVAAFDQSWPATETRLISVSTQVGAIGAFGVRTPQPLARRGLRGR